ncbi:MAG: site-specific integrase, partial [Lachnospiraceae bacterium]|nr:site-specific integrase [Lachnospiraceae bacterium]
GRPRSKDYHYVHFKQLLKDLGLPNVRWHDLRTSYTTLLLRQNFSSKAVSKLLGHATEIITVDRYGDNKNMLPDDIPELLEFIEEVKPDKDTTNLADIEIDFSDYLIS